MCLTDFAALEALLHKGPLTITEIHSKVPLALGSMTAAVDRLEEKGLIIRTPARDDRRAKVLKLTPAYASAIAALKQSGELGRHCRCRTAPYLATTSSSRTIGSSRSGSRRAVDSDR